MALPSAWEGTNGEFKGSLSSNEFIRALYNAYGLVFTYANNIARKEDTLAERFKADGGDYRDQVVYTDIDVLYSRAWDKSDTNVLAPEYKGTYTQQYIKIDSFRQIGLLVDQFLTKRAWMDAGKYDEFRSVVLKQLDETKRVYEDTLINTFVGIHDQAYVSTRISTPVITVTLPTNEDPEKQNRLRAMETFKTIGGLFNDMNDYSRLYNFNGFLKRFNPEDLMIVFNNKYADEFRYVDTPTVFHKEDLMAKGYILNHRYFGTFTPSATTTADGKTQRAVENMIITVSGSPSDGAYTYAAPDPSKVNKALNVFPGDLLPKGTPLVGSSTDPTTVAGIELYFQGLGTPWETITATVHTQARSYTEDPYVICKIMHKDSVKYLTSLTVQTEFNNGKNHTRNMYLTWGYSYPVALDGYPFISVKEAHE